MQQILLQNARAILLQNAKSLLQNASGCLLQNASCILQNAKVIPSYEVFYKMRQ